MDLYTSKWWSYQQLKSKVAGIPISFEIMLRDNRLLKVSFFDGHAFFRNDFSGLFSRSRWATTNITFSLSLWELEKLSEKNKAAITDLCAVNVVSPVYETHPYHKLKNPAVIGYEEGPKFDKFIKLFAEENDVVYEQDILNQEMKNEQDESSS